MNLSPRIVALVVAGGLLADGLSGRATLLVRPWFVPVLVTAGLLAGWAAVRLRGRLSPVAAYLLLLPVAVGVTLTPAVAGRAAEQAGTTSTVTSRVGDGANPLLAGQGGQVTLLQILLADQQVGNVALSGRVVTVEAEVAGRTQLRRSVIVCCAADAQSVTIGESGAALPRQGAWVRVHGTLTAEGSGLVLVAAAVERIPTPAEPFL